MLPSSAHGKLVRMCSVVCSGAFFFFLLKKRGQPAKTDLNHCGAYCVFKETEGINLLFFTLVTKQEGVGGSCASRVLEFTHSAKLSLTLTSNYWQDLLMSSLWACGVVSAATRCPTNRFRGMQFRFFFPTALESSTSLLYQPTFYVYSASLQAP